MRTGGKILVDQLILRGTNQVFCVPGESYLEILNAFYDVRDRVRVFNARHEAGAANMAEAFGKLTGRPGVALVTRGPGACHASIGVHIAYQDSTPMILIVGQVSQKAKDREAFQEINYRSMFGSISKWCAEIDKVERIPEYLSKAYNIALSGRPGPVILSVPENILAEQTQVEDKPFIKHCAPAPEKNVEHSLKKLFVRSKRPMILLGGAGWCKSASVNVLSFATKYSVPVVTSFRRQDVFDNNSNVFCGALGTSASPTLLKRIKEVDLLIVLGSRLGEMTTQGYEIIEENETNQKLIHIHVDPNELGAVYPPDLGIVSTVKNFALVLMNLHIDQLLCWKGWCQALRAEHVRDLEPPGYLGKLDLGRIFFDLDQILPKDAIITLDAGNHTGWPQRFLNYSPERRQIGSTCGSMGYSIPAGVAAGLLFPKRLIVSFVGDGGFMMSGMELMTAVQFEVPMVIIVFNNNSYGTIRMHQERDHPGRVIGTNLINPNFKAMAIAMGAHAEVVERTIDFRPVFEKCLNHKKPTLIELRTDINQLSTRFNLQDRST